MPRSKSYISRAIGAPQIDGDPTRPPPSTPNAVVDIYEASRGARSVSSTRKLDYTRYLDRYPQWAYAWADAIRYLLQRGDLAVATCIKNGHAAYRFFAFLDEHRLGLQPCSPAELEPRHVRQLVAWLKGRYSPGCACTYYNALRGTFLAMFDLGVLHGEPEDFFEPNVLPKANGQDSRIRPLSEAEIGRLVAALKKDLIALHRAGLGEPDVAAITVYFLVIAIRTGSNLTPLLELRRNCVQPHLLPGMMRLDVQKYRGPNTHTSSLRGSGKPRDEFLGVPMDGVAVINRVLELTTPLLTEAAEDLKSLVWLYRGRDGSVLCLTQWRLDSAIDAFVRRHDLQADDGTALKVSVSRLRKNKAQQLMKLSKGDLLTVATLLGNTVRVAGENYLSITPEIKQEAAVFVGEVFEGLLSGSMREAASTPVGRCKDSLSGVFAPNDGVNHCEQFMHCLRCPSYAIAGTAPDLHRLFSFQRFLQAEGEYFPQDEGFEEWRAQRRHMVEFIDAFTRQHFKTDVVEEARKLATTAPHKFWSIQLRTLEKLGSRHG